MLEMLRSLWAHLAWADTAILKAVGGLEGAFDDEDIASGCITW